MIRNSSSSRLLANDVPELSGSGGSIEDEGGLLVEAEGSGSAVEVVGGGLFPLVTLEGAACSEAASDIAVDGLRILCAEGILGAGTGGGGIFVIVADVGAIGVLSLIESRLSSADGGRRAVVAATLGGLEAGMPVEAVDGRLA